MLHGKAIKQVMLVGRIMNVNQEGEDKIEFEFEDSTVASVKCVWWAGDEVREQAYVRMMGKWNGEKQQFMVYGCTQLNSMNEVVLHNLDVMYAHHMRSQMALQVDDLKSNMEFDSNNNGNDN
eukprot:UN33247